MIINGKWSWNKIISRHQLSIRKPSTKMQNAHTRKAAYTFFVFYNWSTKKTKPNRCFFKTEPKPKPNPQFFSKQNRNRTELEKSIPHIPNRHIGAMYMSLIPHTMWQSWVSIGHLATRNFKTMSHSFIVLSYYRSNSLPSNSSSTNNTNCKQWVEFNDPLDTQQVISEMSLFR